MPQSARVQNTLENDAARDTLRGELATLKAEFGCTTFSLSDSHRLCTLARDLDANHELIRWLANTHGSSNLGLLCIISALLNAEETFKAKRVLDDAAGASPLYVDYLVQFTHFLASNQELVKTCQLCEWLSAHRPDDQNLHLLWVKALYRLGQREEHQRVCRLSATKFPEAPEFDLRRIRAEVYNPDRSRVEIHTESRAWASEFHAETSKPARPKRENAVPRVAFLADYIHPMFLGPLLSNYDRSRVEVEVITNDSRISAIWDGQAHPLPLGAARDTAAFIRSRNIDILIEMTGSFTELEILSHRPAPIQGSWIATNITQRQPFSDFVIADPTLIPLEHRTDWSEQILDMPVWAPFHFYSETPDILTCPSDERGYITFGACQRAMKFNDALLRTWSDILAALPTSRLVLKDRSFADPLACQRMLTRCRAAGLEEARVRLEPGTPHPQYYDYYNTIDITLDTSPYGGGILTAESLWMGVPVVTLSGDRFNGRLAHSYLKAIGRDSWVTTKRDDYIQRAIEVARDLELRRSFRGTAREEMQSSVIMQHEVFARAWEDSMLRLVQPDSAQPGRI